jgi:uncharacterized membrane protein
MTRTRIYWLFAIALVVAAAAASALLDPKLPQTIPTHWNIHGQVDGYGSKTWATFLMPAMMVFLLGFFRLLPVLSPRNFEVDTFRSTYLYVMVVIMGLLASMHGVVLYATWQQVTKVGHPFDLGRVLIGGMFLFLGLVGNVLGKVRRNFYIGVRVPWTLASDRVWNDTHRLAAWTTVGGSVIGFLLVVTGLPIVIAFAVLMVSALIPVLYSFIHYKQLERRGAL